MLNLFGYLFVTVQRPSAHLWMHYLYPIQKFVVVTVKDTGTGIDSEILPRLFEKFASISCKGTGLGLFISKSIVEAHDGRIWAENNADGKGATFTFSLPLHLEVAV
jgi:signal transduction histidine kinase